MRGTRITEKFIKYIGKSPSDFAEFTDKITCARVNFQSGKKRGRGLKLEEAAKKLDISAGYLCELETGKRNVPSYIIVNKLEDVYNFNPGELANSLKVAIR